MSSNLNHIIARIVEDSINNSFSSLKNEIKELAPDLYKEVIDELTREQQDQEEEVKLLSTILMERQDLIQKVNTKVNFLRRSVEDITEAVMKKPKKKKKGGGKTSNKGFGGGFGK